jgi:hypothetical protein
LSFLRVLVTAWGVTLDELIGAVQTTLELDFNIIDECPASVVFVFKDSEPVLINAYLAVIFYPRRWAQITRIIVVLSQRTHR